MQESPGRIPSAPDGRARKRRSRVAASHVCAALHPQFGFGSRWVHADRDPCATMPYAPISGGHRRPCRFHGAGNAGRGRGSPVWRQGGGDLPRPLLALSWSGQIHGGVAAGQLRRCHAWQRLWSGGGPRRSGEKPIDAKGAQTGSSTDATPKKAASQGNQGHPRLDPGWRIAMRNTDPRSNVPGRQPATAERTPCAVV